MNSLLNQENILQPEEIQELSQYQKYIRQITLPHFGIQGQDKLKHSKVLIVGAGGLGIPASLYLSAAGIGTLGIIDGDTVERSNLARQVLFSEEDIGSFKVDVIEREIRTRNREINIQKYPFKLDDQNAEEIVQRYDLILNGSDNFKTRYLLNKLCVKYNKIWVDAGVIQYNGQIVTFYPGKGCYQCLFPEVEDTQTNCSTMGIIGPICGVFGSLQALHAIKALLGLGSKENKLFYYDSLSDTYKTFSWSKREDCPCCSKASAFNSQNYAANVNEAEPIVISPQQFFELISQDKSLIVDIDIGMNRKKLSKAPIIHQTLEEILNTEKDFYHDYKQIIYVCPYGHKSKLAAEYARKLGLNGFSLKNGISGIFKV